MADNNKTGDFYTRPEKEGTKHFLWNPETKQFLGRTSGSWGRILLFYLIFYTILALFFAALFGLFYTTIDNDRPKYTLSESLIKENPGLGFRPMPPVTNVDSTLIWFRKTQNGIRYWKKEIDDFRDKITAQGKETSNHIDCSKSKPDDKSLCQIERKVFDDCGDDYYGYNEGKPCVFLKLNKIFDWVPQYYTNHTALPKDMPQSLKDTIGNYSKEQLEANPTVWISCEGEYPADVENLGSKIQIVSEHGRPGFNGRFFPFSKQAGYVQPFIAVKFNSIKTGVLVNIECKAWAENIKHDRADRRGSVHFEILIDED